MLVPKVCDGTSGCLTNHPNSTPFDRPRWIIDRNPDYHDRIVRKGDLRCSILLVLRYDTPDGSADSEVALAEKCSANRIAVRNALDDLEREGYTLRQPEPGARNIRIALAAPQAPLAVG
jgi:hypothetical protein